jgi:hypothetical protein
VEVHLAKCAECQRELRRLRESGKPRRPVAWVDMVRARTSHATMAASDRFRTHARRLTGLARVLATPLRWMRSARTEWRASRPTQHRSLLARFPWSVGTAVEGNVRTAGRIVMTVCRRARSWPQRAGPVWSSRRSPTGLATLILRIGAGFMSVVLVATLWGLRAPDRPTQSAQPTTTAVPVARQADASLSHHPDRTSPFSRRLCRLGARIYGVPPALPRRRGPRPRSLCPCESQLRPTHHVLQAFPERIVATEIRTK